MVGALYTNHTRSLYSFPRTILADNYNKKILVLYVVLSYSTRGNSSTK